MTKFVLIGCLALCLGASVSFAQDQHQIDSLRQRVNSLERELQDVRRRLEELTTHLHPEAGAPTPHAIPEEFRGNEHVRYGFPGGDGTILDKHFFVILYDTRLKIPRWVGYHLTREYLEENVAARSDRFRPDPDLPQEEQSELIDYRNSGYDRGHQAPAADFHRSEEAMATTFLLSNMCPQRPALNRGIWARLEDQVRALARNEESIWVYTGALFLDDQGRESLPHNFIGPDSVAVPTHFFKVIIVEHSAARHEMFAFIMRNQEAPLLLPTTNYQVTVDSVERVSGLVFGDVLPDAEESLLAHQIDRNWEEEAETVQGKR